MKFFILPLFGLVLCRSLVLAETAVVTPEPTDFVRFKEDASGAQLQTSIASYKNAEGVTVDLIGAIHVADKAYYERLNARFPIYDALLYEMVGGPIQQREARQAEAAEDELSSEETAAAKRLSWLHTLFQTLQSSLALESQLTGIDYFRPNFVHADMSLMEFTELQTERNEGFLSLWWKALKTQMDQPEASTKKQPGVLQILEILCHKDSPTELKRMVGRTFDTVEMLMTGMESGGGTVIVTERNKVALAVLNTQIQSGKTYIGIFYGAAHLPDMEKRLLASGFQLQHLEWLDAWSLPPEPVLETPPLYDDPKNGTPAPALKTIPLPVK